MKLGVYGDPGRIRTLDLMIRSLKIVNFHRLLFIATNFFIILFLNIISL